ncbi:hypothetical protein FN846DRAFT_940627 [Sphaerosporella brunnea]|uniref:Uncharacterized protein n=1 Tax=Sphaerosporella brunnea TaxID=1250544 RepID=A0A5J5F1G3_9PEZI|nr:hypothetical protein FN846DRAFT_940627 [Sphaerosporella brunnea]
MMMRPLGLMLTGAVRSIKQRLPGRVPASRFPRVRGGSGRSVVSPKAVSATNLSRRLVVVIGVGVGEGVVLSAARIRSPAGLSAGVAASRAAKRRTRWDRRTPYLVICDPDSQSGSRHPHIPRHLDYFLFLTDNIEQPQHVHAARPLGKIPQKFEFTIGF